MLADSLTNFIIAIFRQCSHTAVVPKVWVATQIWIANSSVADPKFWEGPKNLGRAKCLILGEKRYFIWDTASQCTK